LFYKLISSVLTNGSAQFDTSKSDGQYRKPASNEKLIRLMRETSKDNEEFKFTPFEQGLKESVDWFIENYHQARTSSVPATANGAAATTKDLAAANGRTSWWWWWWW
jgi:GDP-L-fucose synthase